ncbi:MAG: hypothetical protein H6Q64_323 [Firmicutes bacterium]|nr:hypothetical protein [Bacillota bacterium]
MKTNETPSIYKKLIAWLLVIAWTGMLFFFSSQTAKESTVLSGETIRALLTILKPEYLHMTALQQTQLVSSLQHIVRNTAHYLSYFLLATLCTIALLQHNFKKGQQAALTLLICMGYALSDETHQLFVAGRAFELTDLCLDLCGTLTGVVLVLLVKQWRSRRRVNDEDTVD